MKTIPRLGLLFFPLILSPCFAQPPMAFPPQAYTQPAPAFPMQRMMPYAPNYQGMPYPYPQQIPQYRQQGMPIMPQPQAPQQKSFNEYSGYLGLITDVLPSSVVAQLPDGVTQGILFKGFSENSPASSSELKPYDVIFAYDNTTLNHPAQLIKLIRNDKPGRIAKLKVVRKGRILEVPVTLRSQKTPNPKEINGLEIKQFGDDKFRAIVHFLGPNGNKQLRSFEGTREDIFDEVLTATDLPQAERQQLLYAMQPRQGNNKGIGSFFPFGNTRNKDWKFMDPGKYFKW